MPHDGTVELGFGLAIRGQLVDFTAGQRIAVDQAMHDAINAAGGAVAWDKDLPAPPEPGDWDAFCAAQTGPVVDQLWTEPPQVVVVPPPRRGRPPNPRPDA